MLQDIDHIETSCIMHIKGDTLDELEHSKCFIMMIATLGIPMVTVGISNSPMLHGGGPG